jgi:hypothetical protein
MDLLGPAWRRTRALTSTASVGTVRDTLMNTYFYFRRPA